MIEWVMLLVLLGGPAPEYRVVNSVPFETEAQCYDAGARFAAERQALAQRATRWACFPRKGTL